MIMISWCTILLGCLLIITDIFLRAWLVDVIGFQEQKLSAQLQAVREEEWEKLTQMEQEKLQAETQLSETER